MSIVPFRDPSPFSSQGVQNSHNHNNHEAWATFEDDSTPQYSSPNTLEEPNVNFASRIATASAKKIVVQPKEAWGSDAV